MSLMTLPDAGDVQRVLTGTQIRQARAALRWTSRELADRAKTSASTIVRAEAMQGRVPKISAPTLLSIKAALEDGGAEFLPDGSVRIRPERKP